MAAAAQGDDVFVFYIADQGEGLTYMVMIDPRHGSYRPRTGLTQGWVAAKVTRRSQSQIFVRYSWDHFYTQRGTLADVEDPTEFAYPESSVRLASDFSSPPLFFMPGGYRPKLSIISFRWGGRNEVVAPEQWGHTGSSCSTLFINSFIEAAVVPRIGLNYEVWSVFVEDSTDLVKIGDAAHLIFGPHHPARRAEHVCAMYFIYPTSFEENCVPTAETGEDEGAAHVDQKSLFRMMKAVEKAGIPTQFPHCSGFYELLTSKRWTHMMTLTPHLRVPPTVALPRMLIEKDIAAAAAYAQNALREVKKQQAKLRNEDVAQADQPVVKGVAKLGFSWEALDVKFWEETDGLQTALYQLSQVIEISGNLTGQPHDCESLLIQEYCAHDIELRLYVVDGKVEARIYTKFCKIKANNEFGDFQQHFDPEPVAKEWMDGDMAALQDGERQCREITDHWMAWVQAQTCDIPPGIRFDYFIGRAGKGKAVVWTLEICELGFSMLGEPDLPKKVFNAMLHHCLDKTLDNVAGDIEKEAAPQPHRPKGDTPVTAPTVIQGSTPGGQGAGKAAEHGKGKGKATDVPEVLYIAVPNDIGASADQMCCTGKYEIQSLTAAGLPVWMKVAGAKAGGKAEEPRWLYHSEMDKMWYVGDDDERKQNFKCNEGYIRCEGRALPHQLDEPWERYDEKNADWVKKHAILCATEADVLEMVASAEGGGAADKAGKKGSRRPRRR
jgi:hypothetical protein